MTEGDNMASVCAPATEQPIAQADYFEAANGLPSAAEGSAGAVGTTRMNDIQRMVAQRRTHDILSADLSVRICMALGDREGAARALREQNALCAARFAQLAQLEEEGGNYFALAGEMSRMQAEARGVAG